MTLNIEFITGRSQGNPRRQRQTLPADNGRSLQKLCPRGTAKKQPRQPSTTKERKKTEHSRSDSDPWSIITTMEKKTQEMLTKMAQFILLQG